MTTLSRSDPPKGPSSTKSRAPWKKKTPMELVAAETEKLRQQIVERENELKEWRRQLQKLEEARKIFEA